MLECTDHPLVCVTSIGLVSIPQMYWERREGVTTKVIHSTEAADEIGFVSIPETGASRNGTKWVPVQTRIR